MEALAARAGLATLAKRKSAPVTVDSHSDNSLSLKRLRTPPPPQIQEGEPGVREESAVGSGGD